MNRRVLVVPAMIVSALLLGACGSSANAPTTTTTTTPTATTTGAVTTTTTPLVAKAQNLHVTPAVRRSLLDAAAAYHSLPATDYQGLRAGTTYYAFDPTTATYYAAAALDPRPSSLPAQVGTQDDGAYNLFKRAQGAVSWTVYDDGFGAVQRSTCPMVIPASVLAVWNWRAGSCYPPT